MKFILVVTPYLIETNKFIYIVDNLPTSQYDVRAKRFMKHEQPNLFYNYHMTYLVEIELILKLVCNMSYLYNLKEFYFF